MSDNSAAELAKTMNNLSLDEVDWPTTWEDDTEEPGSNVDRLINDWPKYEERLEAVGAPHVCVVTDASGVKRFSERDWAIMSVSGCEHLKHEADTHFISLIPQGNAGDQKPLPHQTPHQRKEGHKK